jgi:hypothetical protein
VYEIDQALDDVTGTLAARLRLSLTNLSAVPVDRLPLLLHPNAAHEQGGAHGESGSLSVGEVRGEVGPPVTFRAASPRLIEVEFSRAVQPRERVTLSIRYTGRLRQLGAGATDLFEQAVGAVGTLAGSRPADYGLLAMGDGLVTVASAYPMVAPMVDGRYEPGRPLRFGDLAWNQVASFSVRTVVPAGVHVVTNLRDEAPQPAPGGGALVRSAGAPVRDFALVAGRDLARESAAVGPTRVTSVYRRRDAAAGRAVLEMGARALRSYERRFGPYPYVELDLVQAALVGGAGGVEFSALVLVAGMLYRDPGDSTSPVAMVLKLMTGFGGAIAGSSGRRDAATLPGAELLAGVRDFTVAHEVAHQYFAGLVGNDSDRAPALDEPLAQYLAGLAIEDRDGAEAGRRAMDRNVKLNYAVYRLLGGVDGPVRRDSATFRSPLQYAGLVYGKAPYLWVSLREMLGEDRLHDAMRRAVARHRFLVVSLEEWVDTLAAELGDRGAEVRATARRWLDETHGDRDLGVDATGDFVLEAMFAPGVAQTLRQALDTLGVPVGDLLRAMLGGGLGEPGPSGPGIDPGDALRQLERRQP